MASEAHSQWRQIDTQSTRDAIGEESRSNDRNLDRQQTLSVT